MANEIKIKSYLQEDGVRYYINKKLSSEIPKAEILNLFSQAKKSKKVLNDSYNDEIWKIQTDVNETSSSIYLSCYDAIFKDCIKKYVLIKLMIENIADETISSLISIFGKLYQDTYKFDLDYVSQFEEKILDYPDYIKSYFRKISELLEFVDNKKYEKYGNLFKTFHKSLQGIQRELPDFMSCFQMEYIMRDFYNKCDFQSRMKWFPIFLWWFLSTIIPMRPKELCILEKDWIYKKDGRHYIKIKRVKTKVDDDFKPIITDFEINDFIYNMIQEYIDYENKVDDSKYLFSKNAYKLIANSRMNNQKERFNVNVFEGILHNFFQQIVHDIYGYSVVNKGEKKDDKDIEFINLGDTRHFAFINMMMMGYNPKFMAEMAGHIKIDTQMNYYGHIDTFLTSKAYVLKQAMDKRMEDSFNDSDLLAIVQKGNAKKTLYDYRIYDMPEVANGKGRCCSNDFSNCIDEGCLFCPKFIPTSNIEEEYLKQIEEENSEKLNNIRLNIKYLLESSCMEEIKEMKLTDNYKTMQGILNERTIIYAYKYDVKKIERNDE